MISRTAAPRGRLVVWAALMVVVGCGGSLTEDDRRRWGIPQRSGEITLFRSDDGLSEDQRAILYVLEQSIVNGRIDEAIALIERVHEVRGFASARRTALLASCDGPMASRAELRQACLRVLEASARHPHDGGVATGVVVSRWVYHEDARPYVALRWLPVYLRALERELSDVSAQAEARAAPSQRHGPNVPEPAVPEPALPEPSALSSDAIERVAASTNALMQSLVPIVARTPLSTDQQESRRARAINRWLDVNPGLQSHSSYMRNIIQESPQWHLGHRLVQDAVGGVGWSLGGAATSAEATQDTMPAAVADQELHGALQGMVCGAPAENVGSLGILESLFGQWAPVDTRTLTTNLGPFVRKSCGDWSLYELANGSVRVAHTEDQSAVYVWDETRVLGVLVSPHTYRGWARGLAFVTVGRGWELRECSEPREPLRRSCSVLRIEGERVVARGRRGGSMHPRGEWRFWTAEGRPQAEVQFGYRGEHGMFLQYHDSGQVERIGAFIDGVPAGVWLDYDARGRERARFSFRGGGARLPDNAGPQLSYCRGNREQCGRVSGWAEQMSQSWSSRLGRAGAPIGRSMDGDGRPVSVYCDTFTGTRCITVAW